MLTCPSLVLAIPASLRFQPTKRPQLSTQKPKTKPTLPKAAPPPVTAAPVTSSLADWAATEDDDVNGFYGGEKRQRGGRKKRKKNREAQDVIQNWDDIYDPSRPNNYDEYKNSDEKISEVREWKDRLYAHRMARSPSRDSDSEGYSRPMNRMFYLINEQGQSLNRLQGNSLPRAVSHRRRTSMIYHLSHLRSTLLRSHPLRFPTMYLGRTPMLDVYEWPLTKVMCRCLITCQINLPLPLKNHLLQSQRPPPEMTLMHVDSR